LPSRHSYDLSTNLPIKLIELFQKIIIEPSPFSNNKNLQNLLLLTAIHTEKGKVVGYINKLENYDAGEIAKIATDHDLYEEALTIYTEKHDQHVMAINIVFIDCGFDYTNEVTGPKFGANLLRPNWMACMQCFALSLNLELTLLFLADLYIKAEDPANFTILNCAGKHDDLVCSLQIACKSLLELRFWSWHMCMPKPITCITWRTFLV
jgi:clathrin heavy chain